MSISNLILISLSIIGAFALSVVTQIIQPDSVYKWYGYLAGKREMVTSEVTEWLDGLTEEGGGKCPGC